MRFLVDECCRQSLIIALRAKGFEVESVGELNPSVDDLDVIAQARHRGSILITDDKDFGELAVRRRETVSGVILLRTKSDDGERQADLIADFLSSAPARVAGYFTVIEDARFRQRSLAPPD